LAGQRPRSASASSGDRTAPPANPNAAIVVTARPTPIQAKAFELLGLNPNGSQ